MFSGNLLRIGVCWLGIELVFVDDVDVECVIVLKGIFVYYGLSRFCFVSRGFLFIVGVR